MFHSHVVEVDSAFIGGPASMSATLAPPPPRQIAAPPAEWHAPQPLARLTQVSKRFGAVTALQDVLLAVTRGRVPGVVGRSGAGKSTVARRRQFILDRLGGTIIPTW